MEWDKGGQDPFIHMDSQYPQDCLLRSHVSHCFIDALCCKSKIHVWEELLLISFIFSTCLLIFVPRSECLSYCSFIVRLNTRRTKSHLFLLLQERLIYSWFLALPYKFQSQYFKTPVLQKTRANEKIMLEFLVFYLINMGNIGIFKYWLFQAMKVTYHSISINFSLINIL